MIEAYYLIGIAIGIMIGLIVGAIVTILVMLYRNRAETKAAYYYGLIEGMNDGSTQTAQDG